MPLLMTKYLQWVEQQGAVKDAAQLMVIPLLQTALERLQGGGWRPSFMNSPRGVFLWGKVGVGKSLLMELFYRAVPEQKKRRYHYHEFMEMIHCRMTDQKNRVNPLMKIADEISKSTRLIYIDEFNVPEIADAMLLNGILEGLFKNRVMLVFTSNYEPDRLYEKGFHRDIFLPTIELLKRYNEVVEIEGSIDYRIKNSASTRSLEQLSQQIEPSALEEIFKTLMTGPIWNGDEITINNRPISVIKVADGVIWLDYLEICNDPRATSDYIELSKVFGAVIISNIDTGVVGDESLARRFLHFIDELYDHRIKLVVSALGNLVQVYQSERLRFEFARTVSRLYEMQSAMVRQGYIKEPLKSSASSVGEAKAVHFGRKKRAHESIEIH